MIVSCRRHLSVPVPAIAVRILAVFLMVLPFSNAAAETIDDVLMRLRQDDRSFAGIAQRLIVANAPLCDEKMPATGMVLHSLAQYSPAAQPAAQRLFGFPAALPGTLTVEALVPGGPAERAGLREGDGIISINDLPVERLLAASDSAPTALRDAAENRIADADPAAPLQLTVLRDGKAMPIAIAPLSACRTRFELVPGAGWLARSDGAIIQLGQRFLQDETADEVAVVIAHELAHTMLHHRRRLAAANVSKGMLGELGRDGRLNRQVEREADLLSVHILRNAGFDPGLAVAFWRGPGRKLDSGLLRKRIYDSPAQRALAIEREIAAIPPEAPAIYAPPLLETRSKPLL